MEGTAYAGRRFCLGTAEAVTRGSDFYPVATGENGPCARKYILNTNMDAIFFFFLSFTFRLDPGFEVRRSISGVMRAQNGIYMFVNKREH